MGFLSVRSKSLPRQWVGVLAFCLLALVMMLDELIASVKSNGLFRGRPSVSGCWPTLSHVTVPLDHLHFFPSLGFPPITYKGNIQSESMTSALCSLCLDEFPRLYTVQPSVPNNIHVLMRRRKPL